MREGISLFGTISVLGKEFSIDVMLTTFEKHHGRGRADALGGETKRGTDQAVRQEINDRMQISKRIRRDLTDFLNKNYILKTSRTKEGSKCQMSPQSIWWHGTCWSPRK